MTPLINYKHEIGRRLVAHAGTRRRAALGEAPGVSWAKRVIPGEPRGLQMIHYLRHLSLIISELRITYDTYV
jgi:hypothetical protein